MHRVSAIPHQPAHKFARILIFVKQWCLQVKWAVYMAYLKAIGYLITLIFFTIYVISSILGVLSNLWLANWSDQAKKMNASSPEEYDTNVRLAIYALLGMGQGIILAIY